VLIFREFLDWVADLLEISKYEDWYEVRAEDVIKKGGATLLNKYQGKQFACLHYLCEPDRI
jgi:hypothetical protein